MVFVCDIRIFGCRISRIFWRYQAKSGYTDNDQNNVTQTEDVNTFMRQRDCQLKKVCCWKYFSTDFGPNKTTDLPLHFLFHLNLGQLMPKFSETETKNRPSKLINLILLAQKVTGMRDCVCYHSNWSNFPFFVNRLEFLSFQSQNLGHYSACATTQFRVFAKKWSLFLKNLLPKKDFFFF